MTSARHDDDPVLTGVSWHDKRWWSGALHRHSVLDYFSHSQFYDRTCLNEQLKMQRTLSPQDAHEKLQRLPGILYQLDEAKTEEVAPTAEEPAHTLYVIRKGRSSRFGLRRRLRLLAGILLRYDVRLAIRWIPSRHCAADADSRDRGSSLANLRRRIIQQNAAGPGQACDFQPVPKVVEHVRDVGTDVCSRRAV